MNRTCSDCCKSRKLPGILSATFRALRTSSRLSPLVLLAEDGSFGMHETISRQDLAVMLYRVAGAMNLEWGASASVAVPPFADQSDIAGYASGAVAAMQRHGIIEGMGDGVFAPRGLATRAQASAILYRMFAS